MKKKTIYDIVLFALLGILAFLPMAQEHLHLFDLKQLVGVMVEAKKPELTKENYVSGQYQQQMEAYARQNFGFHESIIRLYNQYLYDFYRKTYNEEIIPGRDGWFYYQQNVNDYYGTEMYRWQANVDEARATYDREARLMWKLRGVLHDYDKEFLMFMAPEKGFLYPEHLPKRQIDTTTINARLYYSQKFDEYDFPYIEMTKWFQAIKEADTVPYILIPQSGAHWSFSSVIAADSLFRFMGSLKNEKLGTLKVGPLRESSEQTKIGDYDLENTLNLWRTVSHKGEKLLDAEVTVISDSTTVKPNVLFVGNSYLFRMNYFVPFEDMFSYTDYWFYNSTAYYGEHYALKRSVWEIDFLQRLMDADYIVWFTTGNQMYKVSYGFVERALMTLCVSDDRVNDVRNQLMDSLRHDSTFMSTIDTLSDTKGVELRKQLWQQSNNLITRNPEYYFPELAGDSIPTARNPKIPEYLVIKNIKKDDNWMISLQCQTIIHNATLDNILKMEAQNVLNGWPLMRDEQNVVSKENYVNSLVADMKLELQGKPVSVQAIKDKATATGKTFEEQLEADARWIINDRINRGLIDLNFFAEEEQKRNIEKTMEELVRDMEQELLEKPTSVQSIKEKASANGRTFEEQLHVDAQWIINDKINRGIIRVE
jgi:hypothetical protein